MDLKGKVVLVTGASRGIGESICLKMLEKGAKVYGTSRKDYPAYPFNMIRSDVTDKEACAKAVEEVYKKEGRIDIFVSNAGAAVAGTVEDTDINEARWQFDVNFFGMLNMLYEVLPIMRRQNEGRIVLISSMAGIIPIPYQGLYSASKSAIEAVGTVLKNEIRGFGIEVMTVNPGDTRTGQPESRVFAKNADERSVYYKDFIRSIRKMEDYERKGMDPLVLAAGIIRKLEKKHVPVRYVPSFYFILSYLSRILPERFVLLLVRLFYL